MDLFITSLENSLVMREFIFMRNKFHKYKHHDYYYKPEYNRKNQLFIFAWKDGYDVTCDYLFQSGSFIVYRGV